MKFLTLDRNGTMFIKIDHHTLYKSDYKRRNGNSISSEISQNNSIINNSINFKKPLSESVKTQTSFKGFSLGAISAPLVETLPKQLFTHTMGILSDLSNDQKALYLKYVHDFISTAQRSGKFRKAIGLSQEAANELTTENIIKLPKRTMLVKLGSTLFSPLTGLKDLGLRLFNNSFGKNVIPNLYKHIQETKAHEKVIENYKKVLGLADFISIKENQYRKTAGHRDWHINDKFIQPKDLLKSDIKLLRLSTVNPEKGQYSSRDVMLGNRLVSGGIYATFLANDAYNTTMRYSNNEKAAKEQGNSRVKQEVAKIALNMYIYNVLLTVFERKINKSLFNALLMSGITTGAAEILGRMLVGRPIFPSDKKTLDKIDVEMQNKKGILPAIGRMISSNKGLKKPDKLSFITKKNIFITPTQTDPVAAKSFAAFSQTPNSSAVPSFKGNSKTLKMFETQGLKSILGLLKKADSKRFEEIEKTILKSLSEMKEYKARITPTTTLTDLLSQGGLKEIPVGTADTLGDKFYKGILSPYYFIKNVCHGLRDMTKAVFHSIKGDKLEALHKEHLEMIKEKHFETEFKTYLKKRLQDTAWVTSPHSKEQKEFAILKEFFESKENQKKEFNGITNLLLVLDKKLKQSKININNPTNADISKARNILDDVITKADGADHAEYDANKLAQANINLARAITTIFLITDAYNLAIQYTNNNKPEAVKSAKSRTAQEISRIATSAYIMAFFHTILSRLCNGSLIGAWGTTVITASSSDALARSVVGVPVTRKSYKELKDIDKKNEQSKNPVQKLLAYLIGKRTS